jgi:nitrite reductase/ring-hydroxylating ferredoxin subunit
MIGGCGGNGDHDGGGGPAYPRSWYLLCRSAEVREGQVISRDFLGMPVVIFRESGGGGEGDVHALAAHCWHMGAHLGKGKVVGDCLRCPLHHWEWDGTGVCRAMFGRRGGGNGGAGHGADGAARQLSLPVVERFGVVFVFNGPEAIYDAPSISNAHDAELRSAVGRPVEVACPWEALVTNGFDVQHLESVHARGLHEPAVVERLDPWRMQLRYVSRVTGDGVADRAMKWLSSDRIRVKVTCWGGTVVTVESEAGRSRSNLMLGVLPTGGASTRVTPVFAVRRQSGRALLEVARLAVTRWLFRSFIMKDVAALAEMRWAPRVDRAPEAEPLRRMLDFMASLPRAPAARSDRAGGD